VGCRIGTLAAIIVLYIQIPRCTMMSYTGVAARRRRGCAIPLECEPRILLPY